MPPIAKALEPRFRTRRVNEPVQLYTGPIQLRVTGSTRDASGAEVLLAWLPVPRLRVHTAEPPPSGYQRGLSVALFCDDFWCFNGDGLFWHGDWYSCDARLIRIQLGGSASLH